MIESHDNLIAVDPDIKIWRYMDLEKYESFLHERGLFFCRTDKFSDPFEGSITKTEHTFRPRNFGLGLDGTPVDKARLEPDLKATSQLHQKLKRSTIVNCWHINAGESDAMWRLYLKDNEGVAIQSSPARLMDAFDKIKETVMPTAIRYLDYEAEGWYHPEDYPHPNYNLLIPFVHKRREFMHESEFRLMIDVKEAFDDPGFWFRPNWRYGESFLAKRLWKLLGKNELKGLMI